MSHNRTEISILIESESERENVLIQGWVRTRRDSKACLSFVQLHDGTCFEPAQVVAPGELEN